MDNKSFLAQFDVVNKILGVNESPLTLKDKWESFIESLEEGYGLGYFDYTNDLSIRGLIQNFLDFEELGKYNEFKLFESKINELDSKFLKLCNENFITKGRKEWWKELVPFELKEKWQKNIFG
jgi:hypothetical protein